MTASTKLRVAMVELWLAVGLVADSVAGLQWTAPREWTDVGTAPMRAATYKVPLAAGDHGGPIDANIERWRGQFRTSSGKPAVAAIRKRVVHGLPVTAIDVSGEYTGMSGPVGEPSSVAGYRLLGAILENPGGNVFLKFTGPLRTVTANQDAFEKLLASFEKQR